MGWGTGSDRTKKLTEVFGANNGIQALVSQGVGSNVVANSAYSYLNMRKKFKGYASGTSNATFGFHRIDELGTETVFESKEQMARYLRRNLVLGNTENVKRTLLKNFIDNVEHGYGELKTEGYEKDEKGDDHWVSFREKNLKESIRPYVEQLQKQYDKIGEEMPVYIQRMNTYADYYKLFVKEDLSVEVEEKNEE